MHMHMQRSRTDSRDLRVFQSVHKRGAPEGTAVPKGRESSERELPQEIPGSWRCYLSTGRGDP